MCYIDFLYSIFIQDGSAATDEKIDDATCKGISDEVTKILTIINEFVQYQPLTLEEELKRADSENAMRDLLEHGDGDGKLAYWALRIDGLKYFDSKFASIARTIFVICVFRK